MASLQRRHRAQIGNDVDQIGLLQSGMVATGYLRSCTERRHVSDRDQKPMPESLKDWRSSTKRKAEANSH